MSHFRLLWFVVGILFCTGLPALPENARPTDAEKILLTLAEAKVRYQEAETAAAASVAKEFDKAELEITNHEKFSAAEKLKRLEALAADRAGFEQAGKMPKLMQMKRAVEAYQKEVKAAKTQCVKAFDAAADQLLKIDRPAAQQVLDGKEEFFSARKTASNVSTKKTPSGGKNDLEKTGILVPQEWVLPGKGRITVTEEGLIQLSAPSPEKANAPPGNPTILKTRKTDFARASIKATISVAPDTLAYIAIGLDGMLPVTSSITDDGQEILVGHQSANFAPVEKGTGKQKIPHDQMFDINFFADKEATWVYINGKMVSGVGIKSKPGAVGFVVKQGKITLKSIQVENSN